MRPSHRWQAIHHRNPRRRMENELRIRGRRIRLAVLKGEAVSAPSVSMMLMEWMTPSALTPSTIFSTRFCIPLGTPESCSPSPVVESVNPSSSFCSCVWPRRKRSGERRSSSCDGRDTLYLGIPGGIEPGILAVQQKNLARRIGIAPMHLSRFAQQQSAALFAVDAHSAKAFGKGGAQGMQAVVVLVHALRHLLRGVGWAPSCWQQQRKQHSRTHSRALTESAGCNSCPPQGQP